MAERFNQAINLQPIQTGTGAPSGMMSLAQKLEQFKNLSMSVAEPIAKEASIKRGTEKAQKAKFGKQAVQVGQEVVPVTAPPQLKKETFYGGVEAQAYNQALKTAYFASLDNDNRIALGKLAAENPDDLQTFNELASAYAKGVTRNIDPTIQQAVEMDLEEQISQYQTKIQSNQIKKAYDTAKATTLANIEAAKREALNAMRNGDMDIQEFNRIKAIGFLDSGISAGFWDNAWAYQAEEQLSRDIQAQSFLHDVDQAAAQSIDTAQKLITDNETKIPKKFTPDEWRNVIIEAQQNVNRLASRAKKVAAADLKQMKLDESAARGMAFLNSEVPPSPIKSSQDHKDVNEAFNRITSSWPEDTPPGEIWRQSWAFVDSVSQIPDILLERTSAVMRGGDPNQVAVFSQEIEKIAEKNPTVLRDLPAESRAVSKQVIDSIRSNIPIETAVEIAKKNVYGLGESEKAAINEKFREMKKNMEIDTLLEGALDKHFDPLSGIFGFWKEEPDATPELQADFDVLFNKYMLFTNGNATQAAAMASDAIPLAWGVWDGEMMKHAPSVYYARVGIDNTWMEGQFKNDTLEAVETMGLDVDELMLIADEETWGAKEPSWAVMGLVGGSLVPLFRWSPNFEATEKYKELGEKPWAEREIGRRQSLERKNVPLTIDIRRMLDADSTVQ